MKDLLRFIRGYLTPNARPAVVVYPFPDETNEVVVVRWNEKDGVWIDQNGRRWWDREYEQGGERVDDDVLSIRVDISDTTGMYKQEEQEA
jgi:hypothetical protein